MGSLAERVRALPWTTIIPFFAILVTAGSWGSKPDTVPVILIGIVLVAAVLTAVHHAEVVAHRVGEPFGSLLLAVAVTKIEV
jgi:Ca2+:H+ antiporter